MFQDRTSPCSASGVLNALRAQTPPRVTVTTTRASFPLATGKHMLVSTTTGTGSASGADGSHTNLTSRAASLRSGSPALGRTTSSTTGNRTNKGTTSSDQVGYRLARSPLLGRSSSTTTVSSGTTNYSSRVVTGNTSTLVNVEYGARAKSPVLVAPLPAPHCHFLAPQQALILLRMEMKMTLPSCRFGPGHRPKTKLQQDTHVCIKSKPHPQQCGPDLVHPPAYRLHPGKPCPVPLHFIKRPQSH